MDDATQNVPAPESLGGIFEARCDEKGRVKLPVRFATYLKAIDERFFITTLDLKSARIYPEKVWVGNKIFFEDAGEKSEIAEDLALITNLYGDFSTMDEHGRILVPTDLRRELGFERAAVYLSPFRGHVKIYSKPAFDEMKARALMGLGDKAKAFDRLGFK